MIKAAMLLLISLIPASAAAPHYFLTTVAGYSVPVSNPIALRQPTVAQTAAYDPHGNLYYGYRSAGLIWRLNADGTDTLVAGTFSNSGTFVEGEPAVDAPLGVVADIKFDAAGNLFIADASANLIYKVTPDGTIHTFAGNGSAGALTLPATGPNVPATTVPITPGVLAVDSTGNVYVEVRTGSQPNCTATLEFSADGNSSMVVSPGPATTCEPASSMTISGAHLFVSEGGVTTYQVSLPGSPIAQPTPIPSALGYMSVAPNGDIYSYSSPGLVELDPTTLHLSPVPDSGSVTNGGPLAVNPMTGDVAVADGSLSLWTASTGAYQVVAANAPNFFGDGGPATLAVMNPGPMVADTAGDVFFADVGNNRIRKLTPDGIVMTLAGTGTAGSTGDGASALKANVKIQAGGELALDGAGSVYFINPLSAGGASVRKIDRSGNIGTVLGGAGGAASKSIVGLAGTSVSINPQNIAVDAAGDVYFDNNGSQVFELTAGTISLVAGTGGFGLIANGSPAASAVLGKISSLAVDRSGFVYIGDSTHQVIWKIDANGNLNLIAGIELLSNLLTNKLIAEGPATSVDIYDPQNIVIDAQGNVYFYGENIPTPDQVLMVDTSGNLWSIGGGSGRGGDGGDAAQAALSVSSLAVDGTGNIYLSSDGPYIQEMSPYNPASPPPFVSQGGVIGAGGSLPAVAAVSPGGEVSIFGANFVSAANAHTVTNADLVSGKVPTNLVGVCASFGGSAAAMLGVYPAQLNVQVGALTPGAVNVQVTTNCGTPQAVTSNYSGVVVQTASPEFYSFKPDPIGGVNPIAAVNALTGAFIGPANLLPGATFVAAKAGDIVQAYATGFGATSPAYGLGVIPGAAGTLTNAYSLTLGGMTIPAASIEYAGISPCCAGFYQVDFTVPSGIPSGPQPLVVTIAGVDSPPLAYIQIQ